MSAERQQSVDSGTTALDGARREVRAPRAAGVAGLIFAVLFSTALLLFRSTIGARHSVAELQRLVATNDVGPVMTGIYMVPFAGVAFLWFMAVVRDRIGDREDRFMATAFLGSGLVFVAMLFTGTVAFAGPVIGKEFGVAGVPSADAIDLARSMGYAFMFVFATKMAGVFTIVTSTIGMRLVRWPRWLSIYGFLSALVLVFSVTYWEMVITLFPLWVAVISVYILLNAGRGGVPAPDGRARPE
jgi:hypothetical protein